ncbi:MAG: hypothetical protein C0514_06365 [Candidatus Puniceispirillum sp.]|nr:hypothetical protein [Candidatus Puniceispirillum sp.]
MLVRDLRRRAKLLLGPSLALCLILYFAYHLIEGKRGIRAWRELEVGVEVTRAELEKLQGENDALERDVTLLKTDVCPHLLEEEARRLGYAKQNEVMVVE